MTCVTGIVKTIITAIKSTRVGIPYRFPLFKNIKKKYIYIYIYEAISRELIHTYFSKQYDVGVNEY